MGSIVNSVILAVYMYGPTIVIGCIVAVYHIVLQLCSPTKWLFTVKKRDSPPKNLLDKELGQHGYVTVKGLKIHYVEKGDRSKTLMLFVHGFPEFWYSWRHQIKEFSKDYWTVAIDMRGFGESAKPACVSDYKFEVFADDIAGIVKELGRSTFILFAHDLGAMASWLFVEKYPEMVKKYILINGPHPDIHFDMLFSTSQFWMSWYVFLFQWPFLAEIAIKFKDFSPLEEVFRTSRKFNPFLTKDDIEVFKYNYSRPGAFPAPLKIYRAAIRGRIEQGEMPGQRIWERKTDGKSRGRRPPGLYIYGEKDLTVSPGNVARHQIDFFQPLEIKIIPKGSHFVQQDKPIEVNDVVRTFLNK